MSKSTDSSTVGRQLQVKKWWRWNIGFGSCQSWNWQHPSQDLLIIRERRLRLGIPMSLHNMQVRGVRNQWYSTGGHPRNHTSLLIYSLFSKVFNLISKGVLTQDQCAAWSVHTRSLSTSSISKFHSIRARMSCISVYASLVTSSTSVAAASRHDARGKNKMDENAHCIPMQLFGPIEKGRNTSRRSPS